MTAQAFAGVRATLWRFEPGGWLFVRLVLAVEWVRGGWEKVGEAGWTASPVGAAVEGFLNGAIEKSTAGPHPEVPHWYHRLAEDIFLPNADLLAYLVAYGELVVGIALAVGLLTRLAALAGVAMNLAYLWAGTTSTNPPDAAPRPRPDLLRPPRGTARRGRLAPPTARKPRTPERQEARDRGAVRGRAARGRVASAGRFQLDDLARRGRRRGARDSRGRTARIFATEHGVTR
jgi:uncharacterized membrane protein YphA (DoxX/SURF4 family)